MKTNILISFLIASKIIFAQAWNDKAQILQIGVGESYTFKTRIEEDRKKYTSKNTGSYGNMYIKNTPTFFVKFERALNKYIGAGIVVGYRKTEITQVIPYSYTDTSAAYQSPFGGYYYMTKTANDIFTFNINDLNIGARFNCHFLPNKKVDPYVGVAAGYRLFNRDYTYSTDNPHRVYYVVEYETILPISVSATLGVRYVFSNNIGVYTEIGIDKWSIVQAGIVFKM